MCSWGDHPPYDHPEDTDDVGDETIEDRCPHCGRLFFHMTDCPNYVFSPLPTVKDSSYICTHDGIEDASDCPNAPEILDRAPDPEC